MPSVPYATQDDLNQDVRHMADEAVAHVAALHAAPGPQTAEAAMAWLTGTSCISAYAATESLDVLYAARGELARILLPWFGFATEASLPPRVARGRVRVGIVLQHLDAHTESRATWPVVAGLDKSMFEVTLCAQHMPDTPFSRQLQAQAQGTLPLPQDIGHCVALLRQQAFDVIILSNNSTAVVNHSFLLGCHRMAPVQVVHFCQPVSTRLPCVDAFILGEELAPHTHAEFSEVILPVPGSGIRFAPSPHLPSRPVQHWNRDMLGIPRHVPLLVSGANFYKLSPLAQNTFLQIMRQEPQSHLLLYPFGPAWSNVYPVQEFLGILQKLSLHYGVDPARLHVQMPLSGESDILALLQCCDVYLDSFPHSGATSLLDPLRCHVPVITLDCGHLRGSQGAGLLRDMGLGHCVAHSLEEFVGKACHVLSDAALRQHMSLQTMHAVLHAPVWEHREYGASLSRELLRLLA